MIPQIQESNSGLPTFAEAKASDDLATVAGSCTNSDEFRQLLNNATDRLLYRGDWLGTVLPIHLTVSQGVVTFPRVVGSVRHLNICNQGIPVWSGWYSFLRHYWSHGNCCGAWQGWLGPEAHLEQFGRGVQFAAIPTDNCVLKVTGIPADDGAVIQLFGTDPAGNPLRTDNGNGTWSDGISFTLTQPFVVGTQLVKQLTRAIKPITQGPVTVSSLDQVLGTETPIASFDPGDTNPSYAQYKLHVRHCTTPVSITAVALVKLKFIPVVVDSDPVLIPNLHALKLFMQSIRFENSGDRNNAKAYQIDAVRELNLQLNDVQPIEQIPIQINAFGTASLRRAGIGRVI